MRAVVCVLLLSGMLAGLAECHSVDVTHYILPKWRQMVVQRKEIQDDSTEQGDGSFIASEETENGELWTSDEDPDFTLSESHEDDDNGSFIASEDTEEGKLWSSDDDPDWTPSQSQEDDDQDDYYSQEDDYSPEDDYTQEDYSQEDDYTQEDQSQEDDDTQEDQSQEDNYTQEDQSQEDDYTQEDQSQEDDYTQEDQSQDEDDQPFPEVLVPRDHNVNAEYWSTSQQLKGKRDVQQRSQTGQQVVKKPSAYGSEQDRIDSGLWGAIHEGEGGRPGVSTGVEPLLPVGGPPQQEVAQGVEPEGETNDKDKKSLGGWLQGGWNMFTGPVEQAAGHVHDTLSHTMDKIHQTFHGAHALVTQVMERFKLLMHKFGILVQEGIRYCLRRFDHAIDQVQESKVMEKLEQELEKGHAEVAKFFQILGEKIKAWNEQHTSANIDAGLIEGHTHGGQSQQQEGSQRQEMPDFFQDPQVVVQLNKLADVGVLTQDDIIILTEEHHHQQNQHQNQQQGQQDQQQNENYDFQQQNQQQSQQNQQQRQQNYQQNYQQSQRNYRRQGRVNPKFIQFPK